VGLSVSRQYTQEISQLQDKNKVLDAEVTGLRKAVEEANAKIAATATSIESKRDGLPTMTATDAMTPAPVVGQLGNLSPQRSEWSAKALMVAALMYFVGGGMGFLAGYRTLAGRIRRKYGRVKIY
jgi:hypothetical protein